MTRYYSSGSRYLEHLELVESIHDTYERTSASARQLRDTACALVRANLPKTHEDKTVRTVCQKVLIDIPVFTRKMLTSYVTAPLFGNCGTIRPDQAFEALHMKYELCGKRKSGW